MQEEDMPQRAADGHPLRPAASTLGEFVGTLEDGEFDLECYNALKDMHQTMHELAMATNGIAKGKLTITVDFRLEGAVFHIKAGFTTKTDTPKRPSSVMWTLPDGRFTPHKPFQGQLFGARVVSDDTTVRTAY